MFPPGIRVPAASLACCVVLNLSGCGGGGGDAPDRVPVSGTVTYNGQPVAGVQVTFHPGEDSQIPRKGAGTTDDAGFYRLTTINTDDGAIPGEYTVTFFKPEEYSGEDMDPEDPGDAYDAAMQAAGGEGDVGDPSLVWPESQIPDRYAEPDTSPEKRTVAPGGENQFDFDLSD